MIVASGCQGSMLTVGSGLGLVKAWKGNWVSSKRICRETYIRPESGSRQRKAL